MNNLAMFFIFGPLTNNRPDSCWAPALLCNTTKIGNAVGKKLNCKVSGVIHGIGAHVRVMTNVSILFMNDSHFHYFY